MPRLLPITLVGGFLGAGKTSLLHHFISEQPGGHLAVLVESVGEINPDAKALRGLCGAMRRTYDVVEEFFGTEDLLRTISELTRLVRHERVLIEVGGLTAATHWARVLSRSGLPVEIGNIVTVVDLLEFSGTFAGAKPPHGDGVLRDFQQAEIASATILVLNKCDLADDATRQAATRALRGMNAQARIIETAYGEVPPEETVRPASPDLSQLARGESPAGSPALESVVYRAQRPFHPQRFWNWFNAPHEGVARVKGIIWLATRNLLVGGVSRTGLQNSCGAAGIWWAALPREEWPTDPEMLMQMQEVWHEPYGDRRQELILIGERGATSDAARKLNLCLLTNEEFALPDWRGLSDPFPAWDLDEEDGPG